MADRVSPPLPAVFEDRVTGTGGPVGAKTRTAAIVLDVFAAHGSCGEILSGTASHAVGGAVRAFPEAGADAVGTNTFGANLPNPVGRGPRTGSWNRRGRAALPPPGSPPADTRRSRSWRGPPP